LAKPTAAGNPVRITFGRLFLQEIYRRAVLPRHAIQELRFTPASNRSAPPSQPCRCRDHRSPARERSGRRPLAATHRQIKTLLEIHSTG
jgi:hypothetical protein